MGCRDKYYQRKNESRWKTMKEVYGKLPYILLIIVVLILLFSGCKATESAASQEKEIAKERVILKADNRDNCTDAIVSSSDGRIHKLVPAGQSHKLIVEITLLDQNDDLNLLMQTPPDETDRILAGNADIFFEGCENWGQDRQRVSLSDPGKVKTVKIGLHPPAGWDISDYDRKVSGTF